MGVHTGISPTLYWVPVPPNGHAAVEDGHEICHFFRHLGPTSRKYITWPTEQWARKWCFQDVVYSHQA